MLARDILAIGQVALTVRGLIRYGKASDRCHRIGRAASEGIKHPLGQFVVHAWISWSMIYPCVLIEGWRGFTQDATVLKGWAVEKLHRSRGLKIVGVEERNGRKVYTLG